MDDVEREVILPATPDEVWKEVSDPARLSEWFGADVEGEIAEGRVVRFNDERAIVERVEHGRRLVFRYLPENDAETSRVDITIDEIPDGSILRVVERRIDSAVSPSPRIGFKALSRA